MAWSGQGPRPGASGSKISRATSVPSEASTWKTAEADWKEVPLAAEGDVETFGPLKSRRTKSEVRSPFIHVTAQPFRDHNSAYEFGKELGSGMAGVVRLAKSKSTGEIVACKVISKEGLRFAEDVQNIRTEIEALQLLGGHPAVSSLIEIMEDAANVYIFMEYCSGGDLFERIKKLKSYTERDAALVVRAVASVLLHCKRANIMHRDLKPENILLASRNFHTGVRVIDFGQAAFYKPGDKLAHLTGSAYYIAPEVLHKSYGPECDIWSLGVITYAMLCGSPPFSARSCPEIFAKIQKGVFDMERGPWRNVSSGAKDLIGQMLIVDPAERITLEGIKGHPWIQEHCSPLALLRSPKGDSMPSTDLSQDCISPNDHLIPQPRFGARRVIRHAQSPSLSDIRRLRDLDLPVELPVALPLTEVSRPATTSSPATSSMRANSHKSTMESPRSVLCSRRSEIEQASHSPDADSPSTKDKITAAHLPDWEHRARPTTTSRGRQQMAARVLPALASGKSLPAPWTIKSNTSLSEPCGWDHAKALRQLEKQGKGVQGC